MTFEDYSTKLKGPLIATGVIALITVATRLLNLDLMVSGWFYSVEEGFFLRGALLEQLFYNSIPWAVTASLLFFIGFAIASLLFKKGRQHNRLVLALFIALVVGPGLIVNSVFKDNWGRPRPVQSEEFGGKHPHRAVLEYNWGNYGKSFPSGHAAVPLAFLVLAFAAHKRGKLKLAKRLAIGIVAWYLATSVARIVAGGHHFSDVAWAGYFAYLSAWLCYRYIYLPGEKQA